MPIKPPPRPRFARLLALTALALAACAGPGAIPSVTPLATPAPTATAPPAGPPTATPLPTPFPVVAATTAVLSPQAIAFDAAGNMFVGSCGPFISLVKIDTFGLLSAVAGTGLGSTGGEGGPAINYELGCTLGLAFDRNGNLLIAEHDADSIGRIDRQGIITTIAGRGQAGFSGDGGPAVQARFYTPKAIALDSAGNLYVCDSENNRVRKIDPRGIITTVAGTGTPGFSGDGGPATAAELYLQLTSTAHGAGAGIAVDSAGNIYISDGGNGRIRKVDPQGIITTIAGDGGRKVSGDGGPAVAATLAWPAGLAFDAAGNLYVATSPSALINDSRILKIDRSGIITPVAGTGQAGFSGDGGVATAAMLTRPNGLAFDAAGNLYIADSGNGRVRRVDSSGIITTVAGSNSP